MAILRLARAISISFIILGTGHAEIFQCPRNASSLAFNMLESNIGRGQGLKAGNGSLGLIELGIFQEALRESIAYTTNETQKQRWSGFLETSVSSEIENLSNATRNTEFPLDRLSVGTSMILQHDSKSTGNEEKYLPAIKALQESVLQQPQNANGGLWYYNNVKNISAYHNLSYLDGMVSYAPFAILSESLHLTATSSSSSNSDKKLLLTAHGALKQLDILRKITKHPDGLSVHGYDASKNHSWANPVSGASPIVWGRALSWYTLGILNALTTFLHPESSSHGSVFGEIKSLFNSLILAQLTASDHSLAKTGSYGVWQVVDQPGAEKNFIEASASAMTAYSLLRGARSGFLGQDLRSRAQVAGLGIFGSLQERFLIENSNGTLSYNGTSVVCTLSGNVDYEVCKARDGSSGSSAD